MDHLTTALDLFLWYATFSESVLEFSSHVFHVSHTTSPSSASTLSLEAPVKLSHLRIGVSTTRAALLLDVK